MAEPGEEDSDTEGASEAQAAAEETVKWMPCIYCTKKCKVQKIQYTMANLL